MREFGRVDLSNNLVERLPISVFWEFVNHRIHRSVAATNAIKRRDRGLPQKGRGLV